MGVVGVAGIEPATSCSQSKRAPAALHPDGGGGKGKAGVGAEIGVAVRKVAWFAPVACACACVDDKAFGARAQGVGARGCGLGRVCERVFDGVKRCSFNAELALKESGGVLVSSEMGVGYRRSAATS